MKYCSLCGNSLTTVTANVAWQCAACKKRFYANPIPTVDVAFFNENNEVLLTVRRNPPAVGKYNLVGGFLDMNETLEQGAQREVIEETGLHPTDYGQLMYAGSRIDYNDSSGVSRQLIITVYAAFLKHRTFEPNEEALAFIWKKPSELVASDMTSKAEYEHVLRAADIYFKNTSTATC